MALLTFGEAYVAACRDLDTALLRMENAQKSGFISPEQRHEFFMREMTFSIAERVVRGEIEREEGRQACQTLYESLRRTA